ncbi:MAG: ATP-binding protein [Bacteroidaceae bacterium]|nr:ATP-binding protein [Bacteroidaceae bacterium]
MKYPIGIQNFEKIRRDGYAYVDKTNLMYKLVQEGNYYFLSRPRRFGKSLFLSTLEAYFDGQRELFEGLAVSKLEKEWVKHPILHLDLNTEKYDTKEALENKLRSFLALWEGKYQVLNDKQQSLGIRFEDLIRKIFEKTGIRVVILVDEYDKPMLQAIGNETLQTEYRNTLKAFYGALKSCDRYIRFAFLTGVTKFGKVSVFSDLNNLFDLSFDQRYSTICGMTEDEIHANFDEGVALLAEANKMTKEECYARLKRDFDGYHFCMDSPGMYNPFSMLNTLASQQFRDYWFETGTPSFLVYQLKKTGYPLESMTTEELSTDTLNSIDIMDENPLPLLYQSGYLTLKSYDREFDTYRLGFPNREVEQGFIKYLYPFYTPKVLDKSTFFISHFVKAIRNGDAEGFMRRLENFFASGDYQVMGNLELYFQNTLYVFFRLLGFYVEVERHATDGRMDILIQTPQYIYILELKLDKTADEALRQIEAKGYARPFAGDSRQLFKIGINFSTATRRIDDWKIAE